MNLINKSAFTLAKASDCNPVLTTVTVMLFWLAFNMIEAQVEILIFGERFEHWLDPLFAIVFMGYAAYAVFMCAMIRQLEES